MTDECKQLGSQSLIMLSNIKEKASTVGDQIIIVKNKLKDISTQADSLINSQGNAEVIGDLVENELLSMDKAIEEAAARIEVWKQFFEVLSNDNSVQFHHRKCWQNLEPQILALNSKWTGRYWTLVQSWWSALEYWWKNQDYYRARSSLKEK